MEIEKNNLCIVLGQYRVSNRRQWTALLLFHVLCRMLRTTSSRTLTKNHVSFTPMTSNTDNIDFRQHRQNPHINEICKTDYLVLFDLNCLVSKEVFFLAF